MEKKIIILLVLILIGIGLSGCGVKNIPTEEPKQEEISQPIISNLEVLGCMFDPTPCQEKKEAQEHEDRKR